MRGQVSLAVDWAQRAMALNPNYPGWFHMTFYYDNFLRGEYEEALTRALKINMPRYLGTYLYLAAAYGQLGRIEEARTALANLAEVKPPEEAVALFRRRWKYGPLREAMFDGLRKAGLEIPEEAE